MPNDTGLCKINPLFRWKENENKFLSFVWTGEKWKNKFLVIDLPFPFHPLELGNSSSLKMDLLFSPLFWKFFFFFKTKLLFSSTISPPPTKQGKWMKESLIHFHGWSGWSGNPLSSSTCQTCSVWQLSLSLVDSIAPGSRFRSCCPFEGYKKQYKS